LKYFSKGVREERLCYLIDNIMQPGWYVICAHALNIKQEAYEQDIG
jgi:hypothetical protein